MPKRLIERCGPDSIGEYRAAALLRYADGLTLAEQNRRTAAIYLWGYAAEMTLKAAYFAVLGFAEDRPITTRDWRTAVGPVAAQCGISWPLQGWGHQVACWAELVVQFRLLQGQGYAATSFGDTVIDCGVRIYLHWRETLRYHKNQAYLHEVRQVHDATTWLLDNSDSL